MDLKYYAEKLWYKIIYLMVVIVYLICLNRLNHVLLMHHFETPFELLAYDDNIALEYFFKGLVLFVIGCMLLYREGKNLKRGLEDFREIIIAISTIIVVSVLIVLIIIFIDNPILRAVMLAILIILGAVETVAN